MLEKPTLPDEALIACLRDAYGLPIAQVTFLPLGADVNTAVYRADSVDGAAYFVKLRRGKWLEASVLAPSLLRDQGIASVIAPIETATGQSWTRLDVFTVILYPFVRGEDGFARSLSERNWRSLGTTLRHLHATHVLPEFSAQIPHETYSGEWRDAVRTFQERVDTETFDDPSAAALARMMREQHETVVTLVERAEQLADALRARNPEMVLCHADIHGGNVLIDKNDTLYIVDWDTLTIAPKERDLMFIGGGIGRGWNTPEEEALFYLGYGHTDVDLEALTYYRYERIVQDIAAFCEQLLLNDAGGDDRPQSLHFFASQFQPGSVIEIALATDQLLDTG